MSAPRGSHPGFHLLGSRVLARAGFLSLVETRVVAPGGEMLHRNVVRHPGAVVVVPVDADGTHALLVRQYRAAADRELLEVPAGKRDVDGEEALDTARRELEEEIGQRPGRLVPLAEFFNSPGFCDEYTTLFVALDLTPLASRVAVRAEEAAMTVERVALDEVDLLVARREIVDAKTIIGLLLTRRFLAGEYPGLST